MAISIDPAKVRSLLTTKRWGQTLHWATETGSTNDDAKEAAVAGAADGTVYGADAQRAGRGSHGRTWSSPPGEDLYFSVVCRASVPMASLPPLTLAVGLGVAEALDALLPTHTVHIKWPNDIILDGRKCAGILVESFSQGDAAIAIVGIGLNVNRRDFDDDLRAQSTSLALAAGGQSREVVLAAVLAAVERRVEGFQTVGPASIAGAINGRLWLQGQEVTVDGHPAGVLLRVNGDGSLRLRRDGANRDVRVGRVEALSTSVTS